MTNKEDILNDLSDSPIKFRELEGGEPGDKYIYGRELRQDEAPEPGGVGRKALAWLLSHPGFTSLIPDGHGGVDVAFRR